MTMFEVDEAARVISSAADPDANIIFGQVIKENMSDQVRITVIATGFDETQANIAKMGSTSPSMSTSSGTDVLTGATRSAVQDDEQQEQKTQAEDERPTEKEIYDSGESSKNEFGEDFEIPAFLRKVH